jgi:hypothetical protein
MSPRSFLRTSSFNVLDIEDLLGDDIKKFIVLLAIKELEDRKIKRWTIISNLCIPRNHALVTYAHESVLCRATHLSCPFIPEVLPYA